MRTNRKIIPGKTHEGAVAKIIPDKLELKRSVMACMLWEDSFYESGVSIADRICQLIKRVDNKIVAQYAIEARSQMHLRHIPLLLAVELARKGGLKADLLEQVIQRPDELTEFLALYWKEKRCPLSAQIKKGLARAFIKFNAYQLAKYNRQDAIKLRDVLFLCHAKPKNKEQEQTWKKLIDGTLESPDTWEVALSAGMNKKETWVRLLKEKKLGGFALIRNLRNMSDAKVDFVLVKESIKNIEAKNILPFRFIAADRFAPQFESELEIALFKCLADREKLGGKTILLIDVSGSMDSKMSDKSEMTYVDAACGVAICARELCEDVDVYSFSEHCIRIPARRGFALRDALVSSQQHNCTMLGEALRAINNSGVDYDRIIVITDEQSHDVIPSPKGKGYMVNIASYQRGVGYGQWNHIDGFSEAVLDYIKVFESLKTE